MKFSKVISAIAVVFLAFAFPPGMLAAVPGNGGNVAQFAPQEILVRFNPGVSPAEIAQIHRQYGGEVRETIPGIGVQVVTVPQDEVMQKVRAYSSNPMVAYAEPNYLAQADGSPDDPYFSQEWGLTKVDAPGAWGITTGNANISIAILDTGIDVSHPDLATKVLSNIDFTGSTTVNDIYGHGTHVAGIAAASTNNGIGVAGLGYNSTLINVKVLGDNGYGYYSWIAQGIIWAADNGAKVINLSLGGSSASSTLEAAVNYAWSRGAVIVAAAGNNGSSSPFYPAYYAKVIAVAATDSSDSLASWSDRGDWVDVAAPGVSIYSTLINNGYGYKSGTSMASPHVAGLAALVFTVVADSNGDGLLNDEVRSRIQATCANIGISGIGSGRINAYRAVQTATTTGAIAGIVTDSGNGMPDVGATVSDGVRTASTDASGQYIIGGVPEGSYTVTASAAGYSSASQTVSVVAGQTAVANFALTKSAPPVTKSMWVDSIAFKVTGKNLRLDIKVVGDSGGVPGAQVAAQLTGNAGQSWNFTGTTDSSGTVSFVVAKAPRSSYVASVMAITAAGYTWDTTQGLTSASYAAQSSGKPSRGN